MKKFAPTIVVAILCALAAFWGGIQYAKSKTVTPQNMRATIQGRGNFNGVSSTARFAQQRGAGALSGEVLSKDDTSIVIKTPEAGSKIVFYSTSTQFMKTEVASLADIEVGKSVFVNGPTNSDGTVTAQNIQVGRPVPAARNP